MESAKLLTRSFDTTFLAVSVGGTVQRWPPNGEVERPSRSARWRRGRTISQRPRRQAANASRTPPTIVRGRHAHAPAQSLKYPRDHCDQKEPPQCPYHRMHKEKLPLEQPVSQE